jgi:hypothetical protein
MSAHLPSPASSQLRNMLAAHFHGQATAAPLGYQSWVHTHASPGQQQNLLVGDPVSLMVSLCPICNQKGN